jgi:hypothetical protein
VDLPGQMTIGDLDLAVRQSEHRRTVGITVDRDGSLLRHAPAGIGPDALAASAWSKRRWVFRELAEKLSCCRPARQGVRDRGRL